MLDADWLGAPRLRTLRTIGARGIKTWRALWALKFNLESRITPKYLHVSLHYTSSCIFYFYTPSSISLHYTVLHHVHSLCTHGHGISNQFY